MSLDKPDTVAASSTGEAIVGLGGGRKWLMLTVLGRQGIWSPGEGDTVNRLPCWRLELELWIQFNDTGHVLSL